MKLLKLKKRLRAALDLKKAAGLSLLLLSQLATHATVYTVTTTDTNRLNPGTLPWAVEQVNAGAGDDEIQFNITGGGPYTITPNSNIRLLQPVLIDGSSQPGYAGSPVVVISGGGGASSGLELFGGNCIVHALAVNGFGNSGILIMSDGNTVTSCYIGMDIGGYSTAPNGTGIMVFGNNNRIGAAGAGNLISGNLGNGLLMPNGSGNVIKGNIFGLNIDGIAKVASGNYGIFSYANNTTIGGSGVGERNIISGHGTCGIFQSGGTGTVIKGNFIGTDISGMAALGNGQGIILSGGGNAQIGGPLPGEGNLVSGNMGTGIELTSSGNIATVQGNLVGVNVDGTMALPNTGIGVNVPSYENLTIGGATAGARNIISGNGTHGIVLTNGSRIVVKGNYIGTDINGTTAIGNGMRGISITCDGAKIGGSAAGEGNVIAANGQEGVWIQYVNNTLEGNYIGLDATGMAAMGNGGYGVYVGAANDTVGTGRPGGRNVIANNGLDGIYATGPSHIIKGNYIGTDATGTTAMANAGNGITVTGTGTIVGGYSADEGNLISGNWASGIVLLSGVAFSVFGNTIGLNAAGTAALPNGVYGIYTTASSSKIGDGTAGSGNVISGNTMSGIYIANGAPFTSLQRNYIGTNKAGTAAIGNGGYGIYTDASNCNYGDVAADCGNVISGNASGGMYLTNVVGKVYNNIIGMDATGATFLPNGGSGVTSAGAVNTIGGTATGQANIIAGNIGNGVSVIPGVYPVSENKISGNSIYGNTMLGIDLNNDGPTPNDRNHDTDQGTNNLQNAPEVKSIVHAGDNTSITGILHSYPSTSYVIELFDNTAGGPGGYGQGRTYLGSVPVNTDGDGNASFSVGYTGTYNIISATATDAGNNTSEFSATGPMFTAVTSPTITVCEGRGAIDLKPYVHVTQPVAGETLTWSQAFAPAHGSLTITGATASSGSADINPGGVISYDPAGYTGNDSFIVQVSNGVTTSVLTIHVVIKAAPSITAIGNNGALCAGATLDLTSTVTGGTGNMYSWAGPNEFTSSNEDESIIAVATDATGTYTLVVTSDNSCADTATTAVEVYAKPEITVAANDGPMCANHNLALTGAASGGTGVLSYAWSGPNAYSATGDDQIIVAAQPAATGLYTLVVTDEHSCADTATTAAIIYAVPAITAISNNAPVCEEKVLKLSSSISGGTSTVVYAWSGPNEFAAAVASPTVTTSATVAADGNYQLIVTDDNGCADTASTAVTVYPIQPVTGPATVLFGQTITLSDPVTGGTWSSAMPWTAAVTGAGGVVKGISAGAAEISYTTVHGCVATYTVTVLSGVNACVGQTIALSNATAGGTWSTSSASIASVGLNTGVVTGVNVGKAVITYRLPSGVATTTTVTVNPLANIVVPPSTACQGQPINLTNSVSGGTWYSGNAAVAVVSATGVVTGQMGGTVNIYYTPATGCATVRTLTIVPTPAITGITTVCASQTTMLSNPSPGGAWTTSSGALATVSSGGLVQGVAAGTPRISYTWPTGCYTTATVTVNPLSPIVITGSNLICGGKTMTMTNATPGTGMWASSNANVATVVNGTVTGGTVPVATGVTITYTSSLGCVTTKTITVNATASLSGPATVCVGQTILLSSSVAGGAWSTNSASLATVNSGGVVGGVSASSARISYVLGTGCQSIVTVTVNALSPIIGGSTGMCQSGSMTLANTTSGGGVWSSSNTSVATATPATGVIKGVATGVTVISFTSNAAGCVATRTVTVNACREANPTDVTIDAATTEAFDVQLFPNPNTGIFTLQGKVHADGEETAVQIVNMLGQVVYRNTIKAEQGELNERIDMGGNLAAGTYMLQLRAGSNIKVFHFVVSR